MESKAKCSDFRCPYCTTCTKDEEFQKVADLKKTGLEIYRHMGLKKSASDSNLNKKYLLETQNAKKSYYSSSKFLDLNKSSTNEVFILRNKRNIDLTAADFMPELDKNKVNCPRCEYIMNKAQNLLENVNVVEKFDIRGVCDQCRLKQKPECPCDICEKIVQKFLSILMQDDKIRNRCQEYLKTFQKKHSKEYKLRASHSDLDSRLIDKLQLFPKGRMPEVEEFLLEKTSPIRDHVPIPHSDGGSIEKRVKIDENVTTIESPINYFDKISEYAFRPILAKKDFFKAQEKIQRDYSDESMITSLSELPAHIFKQRLRYFFPKSEKQELQRFKSSSQILHDMQEKLKKTEKESLEKGQMELLEVLQNLITDPEWEKKTPEKEKRRIEALIQKTIKDLRLKNIPEKEKRRIEAIIQKTVKEIGLHEFFTKATKKMQHEDKLAKFKDITTKDQLIREEKMQKSKKKKDMTDKHDRHDKMPKDRKFTEGKIHKRERIKQTKDDHGRIKDTVKKIPDKQKDARYDKKMKEKQMKEKQMKEKQMKEKQMKEKQMKEKQMKEKQMKEKQMKEKQMKEKQMKEKQIKEKQIKEKEIKEKQIKEKETKVKVGKRKEEDVKIIVMKPEKIGKKQGATEKVTKDSVAKDTKKTKDVTKKRHKGDEIEKQTSGFPKEDENILKSSKLKESKDDIKTEDKSLIDQSKYEEINKDFKEGGDNMQQIEESKVQELELNVEKHKKEAEVKRAQISKEEELKRLTEKKEELTKKLQVQEKKEKKEKKAKPEKVVSDEVVVIPDVKEVVLANEALKIRQKTQAESAKKRKAEKTHLENILDISRKKTKELGVKDKPIKEIRPRLPPSTPPPPPQKKKIPKIEKTVPFEKIKIRKPSRENLILKMVQIRKTEPRIIKITGPTQMNKIIQKKLRTKSVFTEGMSDSSEISEESDKDKSEIIFHNEIYKKKQIKPEQPIVDRPPIFFGLSYEPPEKDLTAFESQTPIDNYEACGIIKYTLSDKAFIDNGWTMLPTEKIVRKFNVYRMHQAYPEFDWFNQNIDEKKIQYNTGEKLAELNKDIDGRKRWFYRNGLIALDYYKSEEHRTGKRYVIYSNGEPDESGNPQPVTVLAMFDQLGNGVVYDHNGDIRLKYNQNEGIIIDPKLGPSSHWKWHSLNEPPELLKIMIDERLLYKDPNILRYDDEEKDKPKEIDLDMVAIELENFSKEKAKKLTKNFTPFQIQMKSLKINKQFSLKILDQTKIYLIFRDGLVNLRQNLGMVLDHKDLVDISTAELGEVSNSLEKFPAKTESILGLQLKLKKVRHDTRAAIRRKQRVKPSVMALSVDKLTAALSQPLTTHYSLAGPPLQECKCVPTLPTHFI